MTDKTQKAAMSFIFIAANHAKKAEKKKKKSKNS